MPRLPATPQEDFAALRGAARQLSGARPLTMRERLADLAEGSGSGPDLDRKPDVYGDGPVEELEERVAGLLGLEAAAFFPTGTMAQQAALRCWADRMGETAVAMHPLAHLEVHERHAYAQLSGLRAVWPTRAPRLPTAAEIAACDEPFGTLMLELPLRDAGFVLPTWDELTAVVQAARDQAAVVHFDGARLWESTVHLGHGLAEIAELADSVYVSFYKTLGGISGAALAGPADFVAQARAWRHRYGGKLFQQWPATVAAMRGLDRELPRLPEYVAHAKVVAEALAEALAEVPGAEVYPRPPHTHQFQLWLPFAAERLVQAGRRLLAETGTALFSFWAEPGLPGRSFTEVTVAAPALAWQPAEIRSAVHALLERVE